MRSRSPTTTETVRSTCSSVILAILERERFDMVVMGPAGGHVAARLAKTATCRVVMAPPPAAPSSAKIVAA